MAVLLALALGLTPAGLAAQEPAEESYLGMSLEELLETRVVTPSKRSEGIGDAPGIISIVSRQEIAGFAALNLGQVLNRVTGAAYLTANVFSDNVVSLRGASTTPYNNHVLILLNGRPVRDPISGGLNSALLAAFPLRSIERIEIIRGPGSVLYGSCAYAGVINIITRSATQPGVGVEVELGYGSQGTLNQSLSADFTHGDLQGQLGLARLDDTGPEYQFADYAGVQDAARPDRPRP